MESRNIHTFIKVAELSSFSKTAKLLGYSQAAVTIQIRQLEEELGTRLFDRLGKKIQLTESGRRFLPHAREIARVNEAALHFLSDENELSGTIRIAANSSMSLGFLPAMLVAFHRAHPGIRIVVKTTDYFESILEKLKQNEVDLALSLDQGDIYDGCRKVAERPEEIIFVTHAGHPLARRRNIPLQEVIAEDFISADRDVSYPNFLSDYLEEMGIPFAPKIEISSIPAILAILLGGYGVSFLPRRMVAEHLASGALAVIDTPPLPCTFYSQIVLHKDKWLDPHLRSFLDFACDYFAHA